MDQQQQQRTVADEKKLQAAVKGGESPHVAQTKFVQRPPVPQIGTKANPLEIGGLQPPIAKRVDRLASGSQFRLHIPQFAIAGG